MKKLSDKFVIKMWLQFAKENDWTQAEMARKASMSRGWASYLVQGKIKTLQWDTRNRLMQIMGIAE